MENRSGPQSGSNNLHGFEDVRDGAMAGHLDTGMSQGSFTSPAFMAQVDGPSVVNQTTQHHSSGAQEKENIKMKPRALHRLLLG